MVTSMIKIPMTRVNVTQKVRVPLKALPEVRVYPTLKYNSVYDTYGTLSNGDLTFTKKLNNFFRVKAQLDGYDFGKISGNWYYEVTINAATQFVYIGGQGLYGVAPTSPSCVGCLVTTPPVVMDWSWTINAVYRYGGVSVAAPTSYVAGDVVGIAHKITAWNDFSVWFSKNGVWISGDPSTGTSPSFSNFSLHAPNSGLYTYAVYPAFGCYNANTQLTANFGQNPFIYGPPTGYNSGWYNVES